MNPDSNKKAWLVLGAALIFHTLLLSFPVGSDDETGVLRVLVLDTLTIAERLVDLTLYSVASVWDGYIGLVGVQRENERLSAEVDDLKMAIARHRESAIENARLRRLLELDPLTEGEWRAARVIAADTDPFARTVTINRGSRDGLRLNAPVMTPDGVVGRVVQTGRTAALVQLISDRDSAAGVIVGTSRIQGIVLGDGSRDLELQYSDDRAHISVGDLVITSGTDQIYSKGLPVGIVVSEARVEDLMSTAVVAPTADLGKLEEVLWKADPLPSIELDPEAVVGGGRNEWP